MAFGAPGGTMNWTSINVANTFPAANRPVIYAPVVKMVHKDKETAYPKMAEAVRRICEEKHRGERILVHSHAYHLASTIAGCLSPSRAILYTDSGGRDEALGVFRSSEEGVLVASSMDRGVDLKHDQCRVQIIAKCPFPNLGDKQVSARLHTVGGQQWYNVQTVRTILQMCGRIVRAEDDYGVTYILDAAFGEVWNKNGHLLPKWWKDAVKMYGNYERVLNG